jgi:hypothetical protein
MNAMALAGLHEAAMTSCSFANGQETNCVTIPSGVSTFFLVFGVVGLVIFVFTLMCWVKIISKAGYSGWWALSALVPFLGIIMFIVFAFAKWPIQSRLESSGRVVPQRYAQPAYSASMPPPPAASPPGATPAGAPRLPPPPATTAVHSDVIYCSWCGKERAVNAQAIHHCGPKDRPAAYCMHCGTPYVAGTANCAACGTPATQLSL